MAENVDLNEMLKLAERAARHAGGYLMEHFGQNHALYNKDNTDSGIYSRYDKGSSEAIIQLILEQWFAVDGAPDVMIISEEIDTAVFASKGREAVYFQKPYAGEITSWHGLCWVLDPICGSVAYARGIRDFIISIALVSQNDVLAAVVYDPPHDELFYAAKGKGAFLNGEQIHPSDISRLDEAVVSVEHEFYKKAPLNKIRGIACAVRKMRTAMTCGLELCYIACGRIDAVIKLNQAFYDYVGGALILNEAAGTEKCMVSIEDRQPVLPFGYLGRRVGFVGSNCNVMDELYNVLK